MSGSSEVDVDCKQQSGAHLYLHSNLAAKNVKAMFSYPLWIHSLSFFGPYQSGKENNCRITVQTSILHFENFTSLPWFDKPLGGDCIDFEILGRVCLLTGMFTWNGASMHELVGMCESVQVCVQSCFLLRDIPQALHTHKHICRCAYVTLCLGVRMSPFPKD